ncbi:uncharacterized protein [Aegilops tauschii subsp. strangulata]|uniref:uncharacterized protein n=1 Tax=Aegilops tauschii subsp. strangulata TaxID=200361 RepID=UPI003CC8A023
MLYAEVGKAIVDFLFSLLTLLVGTIVKLLTVDSMAGSMGNLYSSVDKLDDTYICRDDAKNVLLTPLVEELEGGSDVVDVPRVVGAGFVQGIVTYTVMDDLKVSPMSSISGITLLNTFGVTDIRSLQEKTVQLGCTEGLEILKASLQSKTLLTDVFLS